MRKNGSFQQGIAGQAIGSVEAGAGDFADGVETRERRGAIDVGLHAAALIVSRGNHWNGFPSGVDAVIEASLINVGKSLLQELLGVLSHVEENAAAAGALHFRIDGSRHDVARRQVLAQIVWP